MQAQYNNTAMPLTSPQKNNFVSGDSVSAIQAGMSGSNNDEQFNYLLKAAMPLLTLIAHIRHTTQAPNLDIFRAQIVDEINRYSKRLSVHGYNHQTILATHYCLCTALDEAILASTWGTKSIWTQGGLLMHFHNETWGGTRFYIILENMLNDMRANIDFVELLYFLLSLGFEGKFYGEEKLTTREEIRNRIFYNIRSAKMKPDKIISSQQYQVTQSDTGHRQVSKIKRIILFTLVVSISLFSIFNYKLYSLSSPLVKKFNQISTVSPVTNFSQVISRPIVIRDSN